jgi:hypothetical protein
MKRGGTPPRKRKRCEAAAETETEAEHPDLPLVAAHPLWHADYVPTEAEEREADDMLDPSGELAESRAELRERRRARDREHIEWKHTQIRRMQAQHKHINAIELEMGLCMRCPCGYLKELLELQRGHHRRGV